MRRWLPRFIDEAFARPSVERPPERIRSRLHARRVVLASLAHRGMSLGAPLLRRDQLLSKDVGELLPLVRWLAVIADHVDLVGHLLDAPDAVPAERSVRCARAFSAGLALLYGTDEDAQLLGAGLVPQRADKALAHLQREIEKRRYLRGNPIVGLLLNHAFQSVDARVFSLAALEAYGELPRKGAAAVVQRAAAAERLAMMAAIAGLSEWREVIDPDVVRSASLWQVKALGLPRPETARLLEQVKSPADLSRLVTLVPAVARGRVFAHTVLAAVVDGRVSAEERQFVRSLGAALALEGAHQRRIERRVVAFVRANKEELDPLRHAAGFAAASPPIAVRVARIVFENMDALWKEIRETGDLGYLLAKRAAGNRLTKEENARMRDQLIDVVKAVPSLAVFTLPGGFVLLPIVLKLLPWDLRPSAFRAPDPRFHAFARGKDDAVSAEDLQKAEDDFLEGL
ncbi:MAG: hypothetical protein HYS27_21575 [Deltaproteobacteria bacterium]|nr:hypothetical protein [Deltaproteobacteria bacterium]